MAKELIISANVYEKKVAIIEDGVVTEFYVERRDENQGVVGNLYKGRVMKVLPGMQSAFVDIGLERDAFLYVDDFADLFDEDEELDFKEGADEAQAAPPQREDKRRDRRDRDKPVPRQQPPKAEVIEAAILEDAVQQLAEIADERVIIPPPEEESAASESAAMQPESSVEAAADVASRLIDESLPPIERITDDDVVRERRPAPVHSRRAKAAHTPLPFPPVVAEPAAEPEPMERITDEPSASKGAEETPRRGRSRGRKPEARAAEPEPASRRAKKPEAKADAKPTNTATTGKGAARKPARKKPDAVASAQPAEPQIERLDDSGETTEAIARPAKPAARQRGEKRGAGRRETANKKSGRDTATSRDVERIKDTPAGNAPPSSPFRHISEAIPGDLLAGLHEAQAGDSAASPEADREASVSDNPSRAEFAMRRGGRNRRRDKRRDGKPERPAGEFDEAEADAAPVTPAADADSVEAKPEAAPPPPRPEPTRKPEPPQRRSEPQQRRPEPRRSGPPTITELLREGQEILVQIAKEPIAKKGARITSHIALPGRFLVYMPSVNHVGVSRKIPSDAERIRLKRTVSALRDREGGQGGFIARTACAGVSEQDLHDDLRYLIRTWSEIKKNADRIKPPSLVHRDLDLIQRILRDQLSDEYSAIRVDNELEYARIVEFVNRVQPRLVNRVKLYTGNQPILEKYNVQPEIDKAVKPRVWLKSGGYIVINQTEALVAIDVNTGKFVGKSDKLEDTITRTNLEAAKEIVRQIRLRDLGGIIVVDFIDMEERKNRQRVMQALQEELATDRSPSKLIPVNDFGLVAITRKRVKQSLERTLCTPCPYCQGSALVKSAQTMCFEILEQAKAVSGQITDGSEIMLRVAPLVAEALHTTEHLVFEEIEAYFGSPVTIEADPNLHQEQYDFAIL